MTFPKIITILNNHKTENHLRKTNFLTQLQVQLQVHLHHEECRKFYVDLNETHQNHNLQVGKDLLERSYLHRLNIPVKFVCIWRVWKVFRRRLSSLIITCPPWLWIRSQISTIVSSKIPFVDGYVIIMQDKFSLYLCTYKNQKCSRRLVFRFLKTFQIWPWILNHRYQLSHYD